MKKPMCDEIMFDAVIDATVLVAALSSALVPNLFAHEDPMSS